MKRFLLPLALLLLAGSAASSAPCKGNYQTGEHRDIELLSVTVDGDVQEDLSAYEGYVVGIHAEVQREPVDGIAHYVRFQASREVVDESGMRRQRYEWHEFYPTDLTAGP